MNALRMVILVLPLAALSLAVLSCDEGGGQGEDPTGLLGEACFPNDTCFEPSVCMGGVCVEPEEGVLGGACYPNMTCNDDLVCISGVCSPANIGDEDGPCYPNETCNNEALICVEGICLEDGPSPDPDAAFLPDASFGRDGGGSPDAAL